MAVAYIKIMYVSPGLEKVFQECNCYKTHSFMQQ